MNSSSKISIITPCYNAVEYIEQTILSIIKQDYDHIEYIIIDGDVQMEPLILSKSTKIELLIGFFRLLETSKTGTDMTVNAAFFDEENNAALIQYATLVGDKYEQAIKNLYSKFKQELADRSIVLPLYIPFSESDFNYY